ncbi:MAG: HEAT repeat domain-containing protein, partial [Candidatus Wallbacteria bacterium]|nr:HEAT repeat domain-containing protein [Candidatus Wallbacteria bacterium]
MEKELEILKEDLSSFDANVWKNAVIKLSNAGTSEAKAILVETMADDRVEVRSFAKKMLEKMDSSETPGDFLYKFKTKVFDQDNKNVDVEAFERILEGTPNFKRRILLIQETRNFNDKKLLPALVRALEKERHPFVLATLVKAVGVYKDERVIPLLEQFLKHKDTRIRANTIEAFELLGSKKVVPVVVKCLEDIDNRVKANAIKCLNQFGAIEIKKALEDMIQSGSEDTITSAIFSLRMIGNEFAVTKLKEVLDKFHSARIRYRAKNALLELAIKGNEQSLKLVREDPVFIEELYLENIIELKDKSFFKGRNVMWVGEVIFVIPEERLFIMKDSLSHEKFVMLYDGVLIESEVVEVTGELVDFIDGSLPILKAEGVSKLV